MARFGNLRDSKKWDARGKSEIRGTHNVKTRVLAMRQNPRFHSTYNTDQLQPRGEVFCGHLCLHVLKELNEGVDFQTIINKFY